MVPHGLPRARSMRRLASALAAALLSSGCGLLLDLELDGDGDDAGAGADAAPDADAGQDATARIDAGPMRGCMGSTLPAGDIAHYAFEDDLLPTSDMPPPGFARPEGAETYTDGPPDCGRALALQGSYVVALPHVSDWDGVASFDFWLLSPSPAERRDRGGVVGRDAGQQMLPGHVSVVRTDTSRLSVRVQPMDLTTRAHEIRCTPPLALDRWVHVGINVGEPGGLELFVDGVLMDDPTPDPAWPSCHESLPDSPDLSGNMNPWVIGAGSWSSAEGEVGPLEGYLPDGAIDELSFSSVRRDFSVMER